MENNQVKYIVYCTICTVNRKIYIGWHQTNKPYEFDNYIGNGVYINRPSTYERCKCKFHYAVKKYGPDKFIRQTIAVFDDIEDALSLEAEIVNEEFLKRSDIYNTALGGKSGNWNICSHATYQYDELGNFISEYRSINFAAQTVNRSTRSIWRAIKNKTKCAGFFWTDVKYDKLDLSKMKSYEGLNCIPVFQYNSNGEYECCYDSMSDVARVLKIDSGNISRAVKLNILCKGKYFLTEYAPNYSIAKNNQITSSEIHLYDLDGKYIASYKNMQEAKNILNIKANIYTAIKLGQTCGGFQWSFNKIENMPKVKSKSGRARRVGKFDSDWNLILAYKSLAECKKENGASVEHVIRGRNEFSKGFRYKYLDD